MTQKHFTRNYPIKDSYNYSIQSLILAYNRRTEEKGVDENGSNGYFPKFQRDLVWTLEQKRNLIYSIMEGLPIGTFYLNSGLFISDENEIDEEKMELLNNIMYDGQQRFTTIMDFLNGKFTIFVEGEEVSINDYDNSLAAHILTYLVSVVETHFDNENELIDYYVKINRGGTLHRDEDIKKALNLKK